MMLKLVKSLAMSNNCSISAIEGNIACGKSFILDYISSKKNANIYCKQEPVAEWTNMKTGTDLLKMFYQENEKWSFTFESTVQLSRLKTFYDSKNHLEDDNQKNDPNAKQKVFLERSIFSSYNVFALNSLEDNRLNPVEYDILGQYYKLFLNHSYKNLDNIHSIAKNPRGGEDENENIENEINCKQEGVNLKINQKTGKGIPFNIVYIRTDPNICFERLKTRDRESEVTISLDYLKAIHDKYEKWIDDLKECNETNLKVINGNLSKELVLAQVDELINE